ncbi:MAG: diacylglycerol kinase family protein [Pseudomonadota bacterium]
MTVVTLTNAGAIRAGRRLETLRSALPESTGVQHHVTEQPGEVAALVGHDRWTPDDLLVINGGDGTVQLAVTELLAASPPPRRPRIACLPGGTTNMTAFDLNHHRRYAQCAASLAATVRGGERAPGLARPVVRVAAPDRAAEPPRCGLFFGIGTIVRGIEYFHRRVHPVGGRHELGAGVALLRTLWGIARHQPPFDEPLAVTVTGFDHLHDREVAVRLLLATTLERLFLGLRPYWGGDPGRLKGTLVEGRAQRFLARMPRLLRGRPAPDMDAAGGYHSQRLDAMSLDFRGAYTLDGELFTHPGGRMRVSATDPIRFLPL